MHLLGIFLFITPIFKAGNLNIVTFNKMEIIKSTMVGDTNDFKLLNQRCTEAFRIFEETRTEMIKLLINNPMTESTPGSH
jgi:hypothetical protein